MVFHWPLSQYLLILKLKCSDFYFEVVFPEPFWEGCVYIMALSPALCINSRHPCAFWTQALIISKQILWARATRVCREFLKILKSSGSCEFLVLEQVAETRGSHWNLWIRIFWNLTWPGSASYQQTEAWNNLEPEHCSLMTKVLWEWRWVLTVT